MKYSCHISLHFTEKQDLFILNMIKRSMSDNGSGISKAAILRTLIKLLQQLDVDVSGVNTENQLLERLQSSMQNISTSL